MAVPHRKASSDKPPISPVGAPQTALDFVRLSGLRSFAPDGLNATPVLWMEHDHPSISMKLFGGNAGKPDAKVLKDKWTAVTEDGSFSAHFEHCIAVTKDGPLVLTAE